MNQKNEILSKQEEFSLIQILNRKYAVYLNGRFFRLEIESDKEACFISVTLQSSDQSFFYPVKVRATLRDKEASAKDVVFTILDYLDHYFEAYFVDGESTYLPIDWSPYSFEGIDFDLKGQVENKKLTNLADQILAGSSNDLVINSEL